MQTQQDLVYSYIVNTKFYDYLRCKLSGNILAQQLKQLVHGIQTVIRYKPQNIICTFDQPVYVVIIYGELQFKGKTWQKGEYFQVTDIQKIDQFQHGNFTQRSKLDMKFYKATTLMLINLEVLQFRIQQIVKIRQKVKIIQRCTPIKQLKLSAGEVRKIAKIMQIRHIYQKYSILPKQPGIYLFFQGIFQLCHENIPALQMENTFVQITQQIQFTIRLKVMSGSYGFIIRQQLYELLGPQVTIQLQKLWKATQELKNLTNAKKKYLDSAEQLRERIKKKIRQTKKMSLSKHQISQQNLATSRKNMLQKCSTFSTLTTTFPSNISLSPQKTFRSHKKSQSAYSANWSNLKQKSNLNMTMTQQKLDKMRNFSYRKATSKLQKQWYHLQSEKLSSTLNLSYFKIKNNQTNKQQIAKLCNYKRVQRIYSDPCFRKVLTFRSQ